MLANEELTKIPVSNSIPTTIADKYRLIYTRAPFDNSRSLWIKGDKWVMGIQSTPYLLLIPHLPFVRVVTSRLVLPFRTSYSFDIFLYTTYLTALDCILLW